MGILRIILLVIGAISSLAIIVLTLLQAEKSDGAGSAISGSSSSEGFLNNNTDRSREAILRRLTIVSGVLFMVVAFTLGLLFLK